MQLGAFSLSLAVKDISASAAFYEQLGFSKHGRPHHPELVDSEEW
jgi:lactoylglutathione lyase